MAAVLRENGFKVEILDCLPIHMGWTTLKKELKDKDFDILCVGDETASAIEAIKLTNFIKSIKPDVKTIAGGYFFSYMHENALNKWNVDFIVRGEGEITLLDLAIHINKRKYDFENIKGIVFKKDDKIILTKDRPLIKDLDSLPFPAYDLLPMEKYGKNSTNHKDFAAIEHGRGCTGGCNFCSIWTLMSNNGKPCYRTKSAKRCFEETKWLVEKFKRKTLNWVDGTFNLDPKWSKEYFELLEKNNIEVHHTAWMRADCIIRDEKLGLMELMARNGLVQAIIGMERLDDKRKELNITNKDASISLEAFKILKKYKTIYTIATLIYGIPDDTKKELRWIKKFIYDNIVDFQFILPYTPYPGTKIWERYKKYFTIDDFKSWNLHRPVMGTKNMTRNQLDLWFKGCLFSYLLKPSFYQRILFEKDLRKRKVQKSLVKKLIKGLSKGIIDEISNNKSLEYGIKPRWYDS